MRKFREGDIHLLEKACKFQGLGAAVRTEGGGGWGCNSTLIDGGIRTRERGWSGPMWSPHPGLPGREGSHSSRLEVKRSGREPGLGWGWGAACWRKGPAAAGASGGLKRPKQAHSVVMGGICQACRPWSQLTTAQAPATRPPCPHTVPCPAPGCKTSTRASLASSPLGDSRNLRPWGDRQDAGVLLLTKDGSVDSRGRLDFLLVWALVSLHWQGESFASE